jgi:outer membrane receptor protein involved in Fe transport
MIEEVVVTATRVPEPVGRLPSPLTILTREQMLMTPFRGGHQADDLLRYVPGVQPSLLSSRYNHPTAQALSFRGLGSRRALVLLDGVPLNDGFGGWINWGTVPDTIERIEAVPGGGSNLYGTWAMGGVIQILTEQPAAGSKFRLASSAGNQSSYTQSLSGRYGTDRMGISLGYRWYHTNGSIPVPADQRGPVDRTNDSRHENFTGTAAFAMGSGAKLTVSGNLFREDRTFGTPLSLASRAIGSTAVGLDGDTRGGGRWAAKLFAQWQTFRNLSSQVTPSSTARQGETRDRIQVIPSNDFGGAGQWMVPLDSRNRLVVGTDARAILGRSEEQVFTPTAGRSLGKGKQVGWGVFGEWIADPTDRLTVIPSVRWDWWRNFDGRVESELGAVSGPRDNVESALNPKLAAQYQVTDRLRTGASVYQAFRAPTLNELYRGFTFAGFTFQPNESLTPERLTGGDVKVEAELLRNRRLTVRLTGHYDEVKDQIIFISQGPATARRRNVGRTRTIGGELDLRFRASDRVSLDAGYAHAGSVITSFLGDAAREGRRVPNVSRHQVVLGITFGHPDWAEATIQGRYLSRQFADDLNTQPIADFVVFDASLRKRIGRALRLFLDAENLTDRRYIATQTGSIKTLGSPLLVVGGVALEY